MNNNLYFIKKPEQDREVYYPNVLAINKTNVFKSDTGDLPIKYTPYFNNNRMGGVMEDVFHKKCAKKATNVFFYPKDPLDFFIKDTEKKEIYPYSCQKAIPWYNTTLNQAIDKKKSDLLSSPCCTLENQGREYDPECFFKNNQLQPSFNTYAQTEPLRRVHKYVSSYDTNVNKIACDPVSCFYSHKHATAL